MMTTNKTHVLGASCEIPKSFTKLPNIPKYRCMFLRLYNSSGGERAKPEGNHVLTYNSDRNFTFCSIVLGVVSQYCVGAWVEDVIIIRRDEVDIRPAGIIRVVLL